ncbi:MAG: hypothetical protein V4636_11660 [Pseudomonadota bacterium]
MDQQPAVAPVTQVIDATPALAEPVATTVAAPLPAPAPAPAPAAIAPVPAPAAPVARTTERPVAAAAPKAAAPVSARALPKVQAFELPLAELAQVAEGSGLQWVNSNPERIAQARAAIAAEVKPAHVPRERPPAVVIDEGPLVLVETRRNLSGVTLPFEKATESTNASAQ